MQTAESAVNIGLDLLLNWNLSSQNVKRLMHRLQTNSH